MNEETKRKKRMSPEQFEDMLQKFPDIRQAYAELTPMLPNDMPYWSRFELSRHHSAMMAVMEWEIETLNDRALDRERDLATKTKFNDRLQASNDFLLKCLVVCGIVTLAVIVLSLIIR